MGKCKSCNALIDPENLGMGKTKPDEPGKQGNPVLNPVLPVNRALGRPVNPNQFARSAQINQPFATQTPAVQQQMPGVQKPMFVDNNEEDTTWHDELGHPVNSHPDHHKNIRQSADDLGL